MPSFAPFLTLNLLTDRLQIYLLIFKTIGALRCGQFENDGFKKFIDEEILGLFKTHVSKPL